MSEETPRLYLITPPIADAAQFKPLLEAALKAGEVACVLLRHAARGDAKLIAETLTPIAQEQGAALLIEGDPRLAMRVGADGVHVSGMRDELEAAISSLGMDRIVGAGGLATRDDAMQAGELGAQYVMFGEPDAAGARPEADFILERVAWWAEIFNIPCVGYAATLKEIAALAEARADFIAVGDIVWNDPNGPAAGVAQAAALLANAVLTG
jgi:thiamine-phosphate pyrophosphorylase